jgi:outer membrane protein
MVTKIQISYLLVLISTITPLISPAQSAEVPSVILNAYIQEGLQSNLALKQESLEISRVTESINQAKALFYPRLTFNPTYSLAAGGRRLQFPVGDMINPIYATLNQLAGSERFPTNIPNVNELLAPNNFHDTKLSVQYAVFNTDLQYNYLIQKDLLSAQAARKRVVENELRYNIATAYYQYLQTLDAFRIYDNNRTVLRELARLNEKLVNNNVATKDVVTSTRYEISKIDQQLAVADKNRHSAKAYFNFLLNRDLTADIQVDSLLTRTLPPAPPALSDLQQTALQSRQELKQLGGSLRASQNAIKLNEASIKLPNVYIGGNAGFQGFGYTFSNQAYVVGQVGLSWDLFKGYEKRSKVQQAKIQTEIVQTKMTEVEKQIQLQVLQAYYELDAANESLAATQNGLINAEQTFRLIDSKYRNGQALLVEYLRFQNDRLTAQIQQVLTRYDVLTKRAALDRVTAIQ